MIQGREQKGAEPATGGISQSETATLEQAREELLRQLCGIFDLIVFAANVGIERIPVEEYQRTTQECGA
jgi:hypothetical protein